MEFIKKLNEFTNIIDEEKSYIMIKDKSYHIEIANRDFIINDARTESQHVLSPHIIIEVESAENGSKRSLIVYEDDKHYVRLLCLDSLSAITTIKPNNKNIELFTFYQNNSKNDEYMIIKKNNFTQIIDINKSINEITNTILYPNKILSIKELNYRFIGTENNSLNINTIKLKLLNVITGNNVYITITLSDFNIIKADIDCKIIETDIPLKIVY